MDYLQKCRSGGKIYYHVKDNFVFTLVYTIVYSLYTHQVFNFAQTKEKTK